MARNRLTRFAGRVWVVLMCVSIAVGCGSGWKEYTIEEVSQALYDAGLISSRDMKPVVEYPSGIQEYNLGNDLLTLPKHSGRIALYPTPSELKRVTRRFAQRMAGGPLTYSEFIKGNVVITVYPQLSEKDAERFRQALDTLK